MKLKGDLPLSRFSRSPAATTTELRNCLICREMPCLEEATISR